MATWQSGDNVVSECFREGEEPIFGIQFDGGFAMGANLPLILEGQSAGATQSVERSDGQTVIIPDQATTGEISAGGLY